MVRRPGLLGRLLERIRGRRQRLARAEEGMPLLLLSYPSAAERAASELEAAYAHLLPALSVGARAIYEQLWPALPAMVVVLLRARNACGCLGHHHPPGTESGLARRLAAELGHPIAEVDLAYESIAEWQPEPLASLAVSAHDQAVRDLHFRAGLLAVLLHELEHLAFPEKAEHEIRARSRSFYAAVMKELVAAELGVDYGMS